MSKRQAFAIAGSAGHDPLRAHGAVRAVADGIRRIWGRAAKGNRKADWDRQIAFGDLPAGHVEANQFLLQLLRSQLEGFQAEPCDHGIDLPGIGTSGSRVVKLLVTGDASREGGGFEIDAEISRSNGETTTMRLQEDAWAWSRQERDYHSNRRELRVLLFGIQAVTGIAQAISTFAEDPLIIGSSIELVLQPGTDNKPSADNIAKFLRTGTNPASRSSAIERRATARLLDAVTEEYRILNACGVRIRPIRLVPGLVNEGPDALSRIYSVPCGDHKTLADAIEGLSKEARLGVIAEDPESETDEPYVGRTPLWIVEAAEAGATAEWLTTAILYARNVREVPDITGTGDSVAALGDGEEDEGTCLAESISAESFDFERALRLWRITRTVFQAWVLFKAGESVPEPLARDPFGIPDDEDHRGWIFSLQRRHQDRWAPLVDGPGPVTSVPCLSDQVVYGEEVIGPGGTKVWRFLIPPDRKAAIALLIRDAHRKTNHGGAQAIIYALKAYRIPRLKVLATNCRKRCLWCQVTASRPVWQCAPKFSLGDGLSIESLIHAPPFFAVTLDFIDFGHGQSRLSITDVASGTVEWYKCQAESSAEVLIAIRICKARHGEASVRVAGTDTASYLASGAFQREAGQIGLTLKDAANLPRSPWMIGSEERSHRSLKSAMRASLRFVSGDFAGLSPSLQQLIEENVLAAFNTRPLGTQVEDAGPETVTPDLLRQGFTRPHAWETTGSIIREHPVELHTIARTVRQEFFERWWPAMRRNVALELGRRLGEAAPTQVTSLPYGSAIVVKMQARGLDTPFRLGHILECSNDRILCAVNGKIREEHHANCAPLVEYEAPLVCLAHPNRRGAPLVFFRIPFTLRDWGRGRPRNDQIAARQLLRRWFGATAIWQRRDGLVLVQWLRKCAPDAAECDRWPDTEVVDLSSESWNYRDPDESPWNQEGGFHPIA